MSRARDFADLAGAADAGTVTGANLIINGDMAVAQRGTSKTALGNGDAGYHTIDRFRFTEGATPTCEFTMSQSTTAPTGFSYSLKMECTTADATPATNDLIRVEQRIEGQDVQHLDYGTSSAKSITLSFWVRSNLTGTYVVCFYQTDDNRAASKTYTIDTADTWEYKTITLSGDQTGVIDNDNGNGLQVDWYLVAGSDRTSGTANTDWQTSVTANRVAGQNVNMASSTSNEWYLTGVKLEVGSAATPYRHESYGDNLRKCQRYYEVMWGQEDSNGYGGVWPAELNATSNRWGSYQFKVTKRARPAGALINSAIITGDSGVSAIVYYSRDFVNFNFDSWGYIDGSTTSPVYELDAEL